jgi:glyoxylase-like metal-dependent hydrolase (beta-lactamase superfamily II)
VSNANPQVESFFDPVTFTFTHVVYDQAGGHAAIIDPVLDFDPSNGRTAHVQADRVVAFVRSQSLQVDWVLETHAHADHLSAAPYLASQLGGRVAVGERITQVQAIFKGVFHLEPEFVTDGSQFDHLFSDGELFHIGSLTASAWHVPGHTPADMAYAIGDAVFVGDTLFPPDVGTARCDFPGGSAQALYVSIKRLLSLPEATRLFMCHDYPATDRQPLAMTTVADQRRHNIHVRDGMTEGDFVAMRQARDAALAAPRLLLPSVQVNIRAGHMPPPESNGQQYLKIPVNVI